MIKLSIVIPVYNKYNFTQSCISDLKKLTVGEHEIIIVDNGSTDQTQEECSKLPLMSSVLANYIRNDENLGFARACNIGYAVAHGENVMFLNNDIRVKSNHTNWTDAIITACKPDTLVGPTVGVLDDNFGFVKETDKLEGKHNYMSGWNLTASKETWNKLIINDYIGPFSEEFGLAYFEDTDLSFRAKKLGMKFQIVNVPVVHFGRITSNSLNLGALYTSAKAKFIAKWKKA